MKIDFNCENCDEIITIDSKQLNTTIKCPYCGVNIELIDDGFSAGEQEVENALKDFEKKLSEMFD